MTLQLMTQQEMADALRVSPTWLRRSSCPRVLLPPARGSRQMVRYNPEQVRIWYETYMGVRRAS